MKQPKIFWAAPSKDPKPRPPDEDEPTVVMDSKFQEALVRREVQVRQSSVPPAKADTPDGNGGPEAA